MLRISNLVRGRIPKRLPMRAGLPNWDRPDPPPSAIVPLDHELTDQQIIFTFFDRNSPEFFLTQPEVYEGDTLIEATPSLLKGWALFWGMVTLIGGVMWFMNPTKGYKSVNDALLDLYERNKNMIESKQFIEWAKQNPIGLEPSADMFPTESTLFSLKLKAKKQEANYVEKVNSQVRSYLLGVKERAEKKVRERLEGHTEQNHHEDHAATEHH